MEYHPVVFLKRKLRLRRVQRARRGFPKSPPSPPTPAGSQAPSDGAGNCGLCSGVGGGTSLAHGITLPLSFPLYVFCVIHYIAVLHFRLKSSNHGDEAKVPRDQLSPPPTFPGLAHLQTPRCQPPGWPSRPCSARNRLLFVRRQLSNFQP